MVPPGQGRQVPLARLRRQPARSCRGSSTAARAAPRRTETPIGLLPHKEDLDLKGLNLRSPSLHQLLDLDHAAWHREIDENRQVPRGVRRPHANPSSVAEYQRVKKALG